MSTEAKLDELRKAKAELFNLRFQSATGQLDNHGRLRAVRKDIARIYTEMRESELGIRRRPAKLAAAHQTAAKDATTDTTQKKSKTSARQAKAAS